MPEPKTQMNANQAAANLALATKLNESLLPKNPQASQGIQGSQPSGRPQNAPQSTKRSKGNQDAKFTELEGKMDTMRAEIEAMMKDEVSGIKDIIIEALQSDGQPE